MCYVKGVVRSNKTTQNYYLTPLSILVSFSSLFGFTVLVQSHSSYQHCFQLKSSKTSEQELL